ncbi:hypothetical protein Cni_G13552 [Canna indica]|uniref:Reverse transcriptase n=1 Tax=Canna indica TaxID=4628 RepID=A0AAQ3QDV0_9LILI|nr:hypothetical protein Cni_G13552 [Canna indica]
MSNLSTCLKEASTKLSSWSNANIGSVEESLKSTLEKIGVLEEIDAHGNCNDSDLDRLKILNNKAMALSRQVHTKAWAKSRHRWLEQNDKNTKFFHSLIKFRKRANAVTELFDDGKLITCPNQIVESFATWYKRLWNEDRNAPESCLPLTKLSWNYISTGQCNSLVTIFSVDEIKVALFSLGRGNAPRPDGFGIEFFVSRWNFLYLSLLAALKEFHKNATIPSSWGDTKIIFIPKKDNPNEVKDFRPISLCNVSYKIISKVIVNRLSLS